MLTVTLRRATASMVQRDGRVCCSIVWEDSCKGGHMDTHTIDEVREDHQLQVRVEVGCSMAWEGSSGGGRRNGGRRRSSRGGRAADRWGPTEWRRRVAIGTRRRSPPSREGPLRRHQHDAPSSERQPDDARGATRYRYHYYRYPRRRHRFPRTSRPTLLLIPQLQLPS